MLEPHPSFETPESRQKIWRYLDAARYLSLLTSSKLHFTRSDQFEDKWEGEYPELTKKQWDAMFPDGGLSKYSNAMKDVIFINCWHESDIESAAMWKLYGEEGSNLAIVSEVGKVRDALESEETKVHCGRVKYIDYSKDDIAFGNGFSPFLRKRKSFSFESEVRFITLNWPGPEESRQKGSIAEKQRKIGGIDVQVDLVKLIGKVLVSPKSSDWYVQAIKEITGKFGLNPALVSRSVFDDGPLH